MKTKLSIKSGPARRNIAAPTAPPKIRQILATTDFSAESRAGVRYAFALGYELAAAVALVDVIEPPSPMAGMEAVALAYDDAELTTLARAELDKIGKREK